MNQPIPRRRFPFLLGRGLLFLATCTVMAWQLTGCSSPVTPSTESRPPALKPTPGLAWFVDVTAASGIDFQYFDSTTSMHYMMENMGSGVGWIDYNNDGWPDLFCVQAGPVRPSKTAE